MNTIQNYGMTNYQLGFQSKKTAARVLKKQLNANETLYFRRPEVKLPLEILAKVEERREIVKKAMLEKLGKQGNLPEYFKK